MWLLHQNNKGSYKPISFLSREEIKLLVEIGFSALEVGDTFRAEGIFRHLKVFLPDEVAPYFGLALSFLGQKRYQDAVNLLEEAMKNPLVNVDSLRLLLAVSHKNIGEVYESKQQMKILSIASSDDAVRNIANNLNNSYF